MREQCKATGRHCKLRCEGNGSAVCGGPCGVGVEDCRGRVKSCVCVFVHMSLARGGGVWFCGFCNRIGLLGLSVFWIESEQRSCHSLCGRAQKVA